MIPFNQATPPKPAAAAHGRPVARLLARAGMAGGGLLAVVLGYVVLAAATGNFHSVVAGEVYRSARPSGPTLARYQRDHGIRTVINLRGETLGFNVGAPER